MEACRHLDRSCADETRAAEAVVALARRHNVWLRFGQTMPLEIARVPQQTTHKPKGLWLSRGEWGLHEAGGVGRYLTVLWPNDDHLLHLKSEADADALAAAHGVPGKYRATRIRWADVVKRHAGLALPTMLPGCPHVVGYDVSSLVLWDSAGARCWVTHTLWPAAGPDAADIERPYTRLILPLVQRILRERPASSFRLA